VQSVNLWEAFCLWWDGKSLSGLSLWGVPFLILGRIGKVMQYTGGLVAVLDLIGENRLREGAKKVANFSSRFARIWKYIGVWGAAAASVLVTIVAFISLLNQLGLHGVVIAVAVLLAGILATAIINLALLRIDKILSPVFRIFSNQHPRHPVRWIAFGILTIGFLLDLLAS
jgi:hypothetical protein